MCCRNAIDMESSTKTKSKSRSKSRTKSSSKFRYRGNYDWIANMEKLSRFFDSIEELWKRL
jgi:hypothetical protein